MCEGAIKNGIRKRRISCRAKGTTKGCMSERGGTSSPVYLRIYLEEIIFNLSFGVERGDASIASDINFFQYVAFDNVRLKEAFGVELKHHEEVAPCIGFGHVLES
jgi:hypothetical protein